MLRFILNPGVWRLNGIGEQAYHITNMAVDGQVEIFLEMQAAERGAARNTLAAYQADLEDFSVFLTARGLTGMQAQKADLTAYLTSLAAGGLSPRTQARRVSALRQFFLVLLREGRRQDNPAAELTTPQLPRSLPKYLSEAEVERLLRTAAEFPGLPGLKAHAGLEIMYASGLRVSELLDLPMRALTGDAALLLIKGKGGKERVVPLSDGAKRAALQLRDALDKPGKKTGLFLIPGRDPRSKMTRQGFALLLKKVALQADIDPARLSPHVLRHSFASHLLAHGADLRSIQQLLGHADVATTQIYTFVLEERLKRMVEANHPLL
jgi:integrase/recombinase XerD